VNRFERVKEILDSTVGGELIGAQDAFWRGTTNLDEDGNDWPDWKRLVGVDPQRWTIPPWQTTTLALPLASPPRKARVVSVHDFNHFDVDDSNENNFLDTPREYDGTDNAYYKPWLEARFPRGLQSNCMTCHQRAVWPPAISRRPVMLVYVPL
jgi:hypothetical protein